MDCPDQIAGVILQILREGVLSARSAGNAERSALEADHVHNLPDLLRCFHPELLTYYWDAERPAYLKAAGWHNVQRFEPLWEQLEPLVPKGQGTPPVRQNIYDDEAFFQGYAELRASPGNLNDLVEQPALRALLPPLAGASVLDMGCGAGDLSAYCAGQGAARVVGADISEKMLALARSQNAHPAIEYVRMAIEDLSFAPATFDVVVSSFAVHYVQDYAALTVNVSRWLRSGGAFLYSTEHPMTTARKAGEQNWIRDAVGNRLYWPIDDYGDEGERRFHWFVDGVAKYHRTMATLVNGLLGAGLAVTQLIEPVASEEALRQEPGLASLARFPNCFLVKSVKPV